jgi:hypothetical protein
MEVPEFNLAALSELTASVERSAALRKARRDPGGFQKADEEGLLDEVAQSKSNLIAETIERATLDHEPQEKCLFWKTTS